MQPETAKKPISTRLGHRVPIGRWIGHDFYKWRASFIEGGIHKRKGFKTKRAAEEWAEEKEAESQKHGTEEILSTTERSAVFDIRDRLEAVNVDLRTALEFAADYFERADKSCTVSQLVEQVISDRERTGRSERYLQDIRSRLGRFEKDFGEKAIATITRNEIADWIQALNLSATSQNNYRRCLVVMFSDAIENGYISENAAAKVKQSKVIETEAGILTPGELAKLLETADSRILPAIAIGAFAGVRDAEIKRMKWDDVDMQQNTIRVRAGVAKSARNRLIPISENLATWLKIYGKQKGPIWPRNGRRLYDTARRNAGFGAMGSETEKEKATGIELSPWPDNGLRHSFGSYWLAHYQNADELALLMGHRGTALIFAHYRALVTVEAAANYWAITPGQAENIISIAS